MKKIITWVDLQGRYRVTSPAYNDASSPVGETEDELVARVWAKLTRPDNSYGILPDHPHFILEDADQRARLDALGGGYFRYGVFMLPNREGEKDKNGKVISCRDARDGAWSMGKDGHPQVDLVKARTIQRDYIRAAIMAREGKNPENVNHLFWNYDTSSRATPKAIKNAWPNGV